MILTAWLTMVEPWLNKSVSKGVNSGSLDLELVLV